MVSSQIPSSSAVERVQAGGEAVFDLVLDRDGLLEGLRGHDAQDRAEELGEVEVGSAADAGAHAGAPELARIVELPRLDGPGLALAEGGEGVQELAVGGLDDRAHLARRVLRVADLERGDGVDQLVVEALRLRHGADEDHQRGGGALLAGVAERGVRDVLGREVQVRARGDDDGVLAAGLGQQGQVLAEGAEQLGGLVAAGQDDAVHGRVGNELLAQFPLAQLDHGEHVARNAGLPEGLDHDGAAAAGLLGGLDHDGGAGGEGRQGGAGRDGDREVPRRRHDGELGRDEGGAVDVVELAGGLGVVVREVDRLADLRIALVDRLAGLGWP